MQKYLLENIIRKFLFEKSEVKLRIEVPTSQDVQFFNKQIKKLITKKSKITVQTADVIRYEVIRIGGREETADDQKLSSYDESSLQTDILFALNRLTGTYGEKTNADYVWIIAFDPYNTEQNKQSKIRAKYVILASYISKSLLPDNKVINNTTSGYFNKTSKGAFVFNLEKINETEWKPMPKYGTEQPIQGGETIETLSDLPTMDLKFGNKNSSVSKLYSYFESNFPKIDIDNVREFKRSANFGCELKSMIEQFQSEQDIPVTGVWDKTTRMKVLDLKKFEYEIQDINSLKQRISTCKIENLDLNNITYPESGAFTPDNTKQLNDEFKKIQQILLNFAVSKKMPETFSGYSEIKSLNGIYSPNIGNIVNAFKKILKMKTPDDRITSDFIEQLR